VIGGLLAGTVRLVAGGSMQWVEQLSDSRQYVYFANHSSHLDFLLLWSSLPPRTRSRTRPVAASDYWDTGAVRRYFATKVFRAVLVDRRPAQPDGDTAGSGSGGGREAIERMVAALEADDSLIIFPEGTRGTGERLAPFKSGLYHLCRRREGLEVVPVHMENLNRILPKGRSIPVPMISRITFGRPMRLEDGESRDDFLERAREAIVSLQEL
jgi:1-acyl-sn-glycerol-3-phosphate acyltransferase